MAVALGSAQSVDVTAAAVVVDVDSFAVVVLAAGVDRSVEGFDSFAVPEPEPELVSASKSDTAVEHKVAAAECKSAVVECSLDCRKWFEVDDPLQL